MKNNRGVKNGFKPNLDYHRTNNHPRVTVSWRGTPVGRGLIILIGLIGDARINPLSAELERNFAQQGARASYLFDGLIRICPWVLNWYQEQGGNPLTKEIIYNRFHKMYYWNAGERHQRGQRSKEHYNVDEKLRYVVPGIDHLFVNQHKISREQLLEICGND